MWGADPIAAPKPRAHLLLRAHPTKTTVVEDGAMTPILRAAVSGESSFDTTNKKYHQTEEPPDFGQFASGRLQVTTADKRALR
jgi:hypothetical protein